MYSIQCWNDDNGIEAATVYLPTVQVTFKGHNALWHAKLYVRALGLV